MVPVASRVTLPISLPQMEASVYRKHNENPRFLIQQNFQPSEYGSSRLPKVQIGINSLPKVQVLQNLYSSVRFRPPSSTSFIVRTLTGTPGDLLSTFNFWCSEKCSDLSGKDIKYVRSNWSLITSALLSFSKIEVRNISYETGGNLTG